MILTSALKFCKKKAILTIVILLFGLGCFLNPHYANADEITYYLNGKEYTEEELIKELKRLGYSEEAINSMLKGDSVDNSSSSTTTETSTSSGSTGDNSTSAETNNSTITEPNNSNFKPTPPQNEIGIYNINGVDYYYVNGEYVSYENTKKSNNIFIIITAIIIISIGGGISFYLYKKNNK